MVCVNTYAPPTEEGLALCKTGWEIPTSVCEKDRPSFPNRLTPPSMDGYIEAIAPLLTRHIWSQHEWWPLERRGENWVHAFPLLVLDFDDGKLTLQGARERFGRYEGLLGPTRNHQKPKKGLTCDRFRVVLLCQTPWFRREEGDTESPRDFKYEMKHWFKHFGSDAACSDLARTYLPCTSIELLGGKDLFNAFVPVVKEKPQYIPREPGDTRGLTKTAQRTLLHGASMGQRHKQCVATALSLAEGGKTAEQIVALLTPIGLPESELRDIAGYAVKT